MKILKRNQLIVLVISLMLITAGYLNFTANREDILTSIIADRSDTKIGDAELVSTIPKYEENSDEILNEDVSIQQELNNETENLNTAEIETVSTQDYYFTTSKLERNNMYSESLETYQEMYNNTNSTRGE